MARTTGQTRTAPICSIAMSDIVNTSNADGVAVIELNLPEKRNAMGVAMLEGILEALDQARSDDAVRAVVITGAGGTFSAGADVTEKVDADGAVERMRLFSRMYEHVTEFPKPTVAAVDGHCIGGGVEVAAGCDLRIATKQAKFKFPGALFGIPVGTARLEALVGLSHAKDLLMTARTFDAEEAHRIGFVNRLVEADALVEEAVTAAKSMSDNPGAMDQKRLLTEASNLPARVQTENRALDRWQRDTAAGGKGTGLRSGGKQSAPDPPS